MNDDINIYDIYIHAIQLDLCIAFDKASDTMSQDSEDVKKLGLNNDELQDEDDEKKNVLIDEDFFGDIEGKLKANNLRYIKWYLYPVSENDYE